ncbi:hypothetical protein GCM10008931_43710 [Oceanobacillus oncorhynchi subsp. oncorhynchi]|uniref:hypothetical protein n=1 Tax=Oceanobacillus oncorhynchi TaxID=545501 RepID=UPI0031E313E5
MQLKIKQSYHATGDREGYRWDVYNQEHDYLGVIKNFPLAKCGYGDTVKLNGVVYTIIEEYDSDLPYEEIDEVVYFELEPAEIDVDYDLGVITK